MRILSSKVRAAGGRSDWSARNTLAVRAAVCGLASWAVAGCGRISGQRGNPDGGGPVDASRPVDAGPIVSASPVVISAATRTPRTTTWSVNYWQWMPTYGDDVTGTDALVAALKPAVLRIGGYNNDANTPDPFSDAQFDQAVAYARAIGAEPLIQVPHLADTNGQPPTPATAAAMVTYANVTKGYGVKYFAVGNEPDLYSTQGSLVDSTLPAIVGYTPADYCASVTAYVAAMKAVDPTIQIVGPDLAYKYQAGSAENDWLTPILTGCGQLFDIVSIHRYPFDASQTTLATVAGDPASFRQVIASVRGILQNTGYADKPLALTEMNVAYDATTCVLDASPGTVGSALWMADSLGAAIELGLWTSAVWDISDTDDWALGLIGTPPAHTPRPEYYAYGLYADYFGPTLVKVTSEPAGVSVYASRNQADDTTDIVVVNWNATATALAFQVTDLTKAPGTATFVLPPVSIAAVEIPDTGAAKAWTYGEAQRRTASAPQSLAAGATVGPAGDGGANAGGTDGGAGAGTIVGTGCATDGGLVCPEVVASSPTITSMGSTSDAGLFFGAGTDLWGSFTYASTGPTPPTATVTPDGDGFQVSGGSLGPDDYEGVGLYYDSASCLDVVAYTGLKFDFAGDLGGCVFSVGLTSSDDLSPSNDAVRGACPGTNCYGPIADETAAALAATPSAPTLQVPFASMSGGSPIGAVDPTKIVSMQWQLVAMTDGDAGGCSANFSVENISFY
jgi:hypothetical protein